MPIQITSARIVAPDTPTYLCFRNKDGVVIYDSRKGGWQQIEDPEKRRNHLSHLRNAIKKGEEYLAQNPDPKVEAKIERYRRQARFYEY